MSTLSALYKSMAGLLGFTSSLDNLSNNVANVNTPGFKGRDVFFQDLQDLSQGSGGLGKGVSESGQATRFEQGEVRETGNTTDLAISGEGFFILDNNGESYLTRAGQFVIRDGYLVDQANGYRVQGLNASGSLVDISLDEYSSQLAVPTSLVQIAGNLSALAPNASSYPAASEDPISISIIDGLGGTRELNLRFIKDIANQWNVELTDADGNPVGGDHQVTFLGDGSIDPVTAQMTVNYTPYRLLVGVELEQSVTASDAQTVTGTLDGVPSFSIPVENGAVIATLDNGAVQFNSSGTYGFDATGALVDAATGLAVASRTPSGEVEAFSVSDLLTSASEPTATVALQGVLSADALTGDTFPADPATTPFTVDTYTSAGAVETLSFVFTKVSATRWSVQTFDSSNAPIGASRSIDFNAAGVIDPSDELVSFTYTPAGGTSQTIGLRLGPTGASVGLSQSAGTTSALTLHEVDGRPEGTITEVQFDEAGRIQITYDNGDVQAGPQLAVVEDNPGGATQFVLDFSASGASDGLTGYSVASDVQVIDTNGSEPGFLSSLRFDTSGNLELVYSNGEQVDGPSIALAVVPNKNVLTSMGSNLFRTAAWDGISIARAGEKGAGLISPESIELSNVELSREFAEIIIVQRGYQASSQVLNVTNEMLQNLYESTGGR